jgi:hypothetical protein
LNNNQDDSSVDDSNNKDPSSTDEEYSEEEQAPLKKSKGMKQEKTDSTQNSSEHKAKSQVRSDAKIAKEKWIIGVLDSMKDKGASYPRMACIAKEEFGEPPPNLPKTIVAVSEWMMEQMDDMA